MPLYGKYLPQFIIFSIGTQGRLRTIAFSGNSQKVGFLKSAHFDVKRGAAIYGEKEKTENRYYYFGCPAGVKRWRSCGAVYLFAVFRFGTDHGNRAAQYTGFKSFRDRSVL